VNRDDLYSLLALAPPLAVRLHADGAEAWDRLGLLVLALGIGFGAAAAFARAAGRPLGSGIAVTAVVFAVMLPEPLSPTRTALAVAFGAVFGREVFGGRAILPPALLALAFAIFSFPLGGFELSDILMESVDLPLALSCLPGAAILAFRGVLAWEVAGGAAVGAAAAAGLWMDEAAWWETLALGSFAPGVLFLAAAPESAVASAGARWLHGALVGILIIVIRFANPDQPDGVVFGALLGGLFAPLFDRTLGWRPRRA
jgi:Na+-transporting NADH:ubiquinone oxidoreductase subunit NqrB